MHRWHSDLLTHNDTTHDDGYEDDIQVDASGITVPLSKSLGKSITMLGCSAAFLWRPEWRCVSANFRDSKEIMMTSDSEAEYKYSSSYNVPLKSELPTTCPAGELRCVNGNCITISQLCDKVSPDMQVLRFPIFIYAIGFSFIWFGGSGNWLSGWGRWGNVCISKWTERCSKSSR